MFYLKLFQDPWKVRQDVVDIPLPEKPEELPDVFQIFNDVEPESLRPFVPEPRPAPVFKPVEPIFINQIPEIKPIEPAIPVNFPNLQPALPVQPNIFNSAPFYQPPVYQTPSYQPIYREQNFSIWLNDETNNVWKFLFHNKAQNFYT